MWVKGGVRIDLKNEWVNGWDDGIYEREPKSGDIVCISSSLHIFKYELQLHEHEFYEVY
jgi:hypothetical protein